MTKVNGRQSLPALDNSKSVKNPDLLNIADKNYTDTILKYGGLATKFPQLETDAKTLVGAINELKNQDVPSDISVITVEVERGNDWYPHQIHGDGYSGLRYTRYLDLSIPADSNIIISPYPGDSYSTRIFWYRGIYAYQGGSNVRLQANGMEPHSPDTFKLNIAYWGHESKVFNTYYSGITNVWLVSLPVSGWDATTHIIEVTVPGVEDGTIQYIYPHFVEEEVPDMADVLLLQQANICDAGQSHDTIRLYAENIPTKSLSIKVIVYA